MPYSSTFDLPANLQALMCKGAQNAFVDAFNKAWEKYANESYCFRVAWTAVKQAGYKKSKDTGVWTKV
jgi:cation transport regulator